ncbi:hypothetical protein BDP27DRAFT_1421143 [Rhodocollybia butyracea]|uniref:Uncharacterized protein n=1 Tax=Rhodocollybia butyracea TaxID=206335 RepID=A0A9P5PTZ0_9AGAR|nr:hypothetical protein BDP27DRAFT_1421143 [Rhodocollybia butyracea]
MNLIRIRIDVSKDATSHRLQPRCRSIVSHTLPRPQRSFAIDTVAHSSLDTPLDTPTFQQPSPSQNPNYSPSSVPTNISPTSQEIPSSIEDGNLNHSPSVTPPVEDDLDHEHNWFPKIFKTDMDELGLFRFLTDILAPGIQDPSTDRSPPSCPSPHLRLSPEPQDLYGPYPNASTFLVTDWRYHHHTTSNEAMDDLVHNVILNAEFDAQHLTQYNAKRELEKLDAWLAPEPLLDHTSTPSSSGPIPFNASVPDKWQSSSVSLAMPRKDSISPSEQDAPQLVIDGDPSFLDFDLKPYKFFWKPSENKPAQRVYADFGTTSLWPIYLYFGNLSKYVCGKMSSHAAQHLAYIPSLPDLFEDIYKAEYGTKPTDDVKRFLKRDLYWVIWLLLLNDDFVHAYVYRIIIECFDGILRLIFPRFFSYATDYPEKILLACIKYLADCLCSRCTARRSQVSELGLRIDMERHVSQKREDSLDHQNQVEVAREKIFKKGYGVESEAVCKVLKTKSWTTTRSAFSQRLFEHGFDHFEMYAPDMLHEWGGKWKDILKALLRLLQSLKDNLLQILDQRYEV